MTPRGWTLAAAAALAVIAVSLPRASAPARFRQGWSRDAAVERARAAAARIDLDAKSWEARVSARHGLADRLRFERVAQHPLAASFSPLVYQVILRDPSSGRRLRIDLYETGRVALVKLTGGTRADTDKVFALLAGPAAGALAAQPRERPDAGLQWKLEAPGRWKLEAPGRGELTARIRIGSQQNGALDAWFEPVFGEGYSGGDVSGHAWKEVAIGVGAMFIVVGVCFAIVRILLLVRRRRDHLRFALVPLLLYVAVLALYGLSGQGGTRFGWGIRNDPWQSGDWGATMLGRPWLLVLPLAAGFTWTRGADARRWTGVILAAAHRLLNRRAGREICVGMAAGCIAAAIACAAIALGAPSLTTAQPLLDRLPLLATAARFVTPHHIAIVLLAVWILPMLDRRPRQRRLWTGIAWLGGFLACCLGTLPVEIDGWFLLPVALITWTVYRQVLFDQGLLALLAALACSDALQFTALALTGGNHLPGLFSLAVLGLGFALFARAAGRGRAIDEEEIAFELARRNEPSARNLLSEREMLLGEFAEARSAQQALLPAEPPRIEGYSFAAACVPAREVGGDLYDFLPFPGGRWGLCVADVSGKGVPASLYMTVLKGMLLAESLQGASLESIALAANERLHAAGRHRTFVTLILGLLDPPAARLELLRAGHNPPLLRRVSGECLYLQPDGLGLGLASNRLFGRTIRQQTLFLSPGDLLVLYSDGLTEAMNPHRELYGEERLQRVVERAGALDAPQALAVILEDLNLFRNGADAHDDLTLLIVHKRPEAAPAAVV
jgi:serine phosphatase RsbU (regulator of sigma subunit)